MPRKIKRNLKHNVVCNQFIKLLEGFDINLFILKPPLPNGEAEVYLLVEDVEREEAQDVQRDHSSRRSVPSTVFSSQQYKENFQFTYRMNIWTSSGRFYPGSWIRFLLH